jgi:hypothetical protein
MQIKLDALLAADENVPNGIMNLHNLEDEDLHRLETTFERLAGKRDIDAIIRSLEKLKERAG